MRVSLGLHTTLGRGVLYRWVKIIYTYMYLYIYSDFLKRISNIQLKIKLLIYNLNCSN